MPLISRKKLRLSILILWSLEPHTKLLSHLLRYYLQSVNLNLFQRMTLQHKNQVTILPSSPIGRMEKKIFTTKDTLNTLTIHCHSRVTLLTRATSLKSKWSNWKDISTWSKLLDNQELLRPCLSCVWPTINLRSLSLRPQTKRFTRPSSWVDALRQASLLLIQLSPRPSMVTSTRSTRGSLWNTSIASQK